MASIKEKPNDSEKNESGSSSGQNEQSLTGSREELKETEQSEQIFDYAQEGEEEEGEPVVEEFKEGDFTKQG